MVCFYLFYRVSPIFRRFIYNVLGQILFQFFLVALNALFACAEMAFVTVNPNKLFQLSEEGNKKALRLLKVTENQAKFLATIQVGITLVNLLGSAFAAENFSSRLTDLFISLNISIAPSVLHTISLVVITLILMYFTVVVGELIPKKIGLRYAENISLALSGLIIVFSKIFAPVVWLLSSSANCVLRLFGIDPNSAEDENTEEEIRMMVTAGSQKGTIQQDEKDMIQNIFEFDDIIAGEVMTHRTQVVMLWVDETDEEWEKTITDNRHSIYPICSDTADNIVGLLYTKDYFRLADRSRANVMENAVRPAYFVPDTVKADILFKNMQQSKRHFAVVLDEYGGMSGIITMNDLLEQIVGDLDDDILMPQEPHLIERIDSRTWRINGAADLEEVSEKLKVKLPLDDYDTFGGMVFGLLGTVPDDGATPEIEEFGLQIKVKKIKDHRLELALVCVTDLDVLETKIQSKEADN